MPEDLPLPEWPKPSREDGASAEPTSFEPIPASDREPTSFEPIPVSGREPSSFEPIPASDREPSSFEPIPVNSVTEASPFSQVSVNKSSELSRFDLVHTGESEAVSFEPIPINNAGEVAEFRVEAGTQDGGVQVVPVSGQESQGEVLRSIEQHLERIVDLIEDMTG